jgi:hypothetical protein
MGKAGSLQGVGGISQPVASVFLAYGAGLVLYTVSATALHLLGYWLGLRMSSAVFGDFEPWKDVEWRRVARWYIGNELSPILERPDPPEVLAATIEDLKLRLPDPGLHSQQLFDLNKSQLDRMGADLQWYAWYQALGFCYPQPEYRGFTEFPFIVVVHSMVVAVMVLLTLAHSADWRAWSVSLVVFLVTFLYDVQQALAYLRDPGGRYRQMAGMLREARATSASSGRLEFGGSVEAAATPAKSAE